MGDMNLMFIVKPHFCVPPNTITSIFKGFPARVTKIYSEKYLRAEIKYLTDIFCENGHDRKALQKIINNFEKKTRSTNSNNNNNNNNNNSNNNNSNNNNNNNNNTDKKQTITFPWIPKIGQKPNKKHKSLDLE